MELYRCTGRSPSGLRYLGEAVIRATSSAASIQRSGHQRLELVEAAGGRQVDAGLSETKSKVALIAP